jgi:Flp pilus assembly protein TadB
MDAVYYVSRIYTNEQEGRRMSLISVVVVLIVVGVILWLINTYVPMDGKIKSILNVVVLIVVVLWLLQSFGILDDIKGIRIK